VEPQGSQVRQKARHGSAKLDHDVCWRHGTTRHTPALIGSSRKRKSLFGFVHRRASDLAPYRLVERRREQLKVHGPATRRVLMGEALQNVSAHFQQIPRDHAISPFVLAPISPVYLIRALERVPAGFFS
jgi:hypothetical protein